MGLSPINDAVLCLSSFFKPAVAIFRLREDIISLAIFNWPTPPSTIIKSGFGRLSFNTLKYLYILFTEKEECLYESIKSTL